MHVAFYAPLKAPTHPVPSGDRRMARALIAAIETGGHTVELASELRSLDSAGDAGVQTEIRAAASAEAGRLVDDYQAGRRAQPSLWFTYHVYYKAPDWLGPTVSSSLGIPYVTAEASFAPKRADGPWAIGHEQTRAALLAADAHFCLTRDDREGLRRLLGDGGRLVDLPPFIEAAPEANDEMRAARREALCRDAGFDASSVVIAVVAMMRTGDKEASYLMLAETLAALVDLQWGLVVVGDGEARARIEAAFAAVPQGRVHWVGAVPPEVVGDTLAAADLYAWPAHNEAYGMAFLEAQAWGLPVVAQATRGVPDVVADGRSGLLTPEGDKAAFRDAVAALISDRKRRAAMGAAARDFVRAERTIDRASVIIDQVFRSLAGH